MRQVNLAFVESVSFQQWQRTAQKARARALAEGAAHVFQPRIWARLKRILVGYNHDKCMYCEFKGTAADHYAAEHYRPKSEVTEGRSRIAHNGYYWLAYEWQNILLSCTKCNGPHSNGERESHPGKATEFPISKTRISGPGSDPSKWMDDLVAEEPLLLHPYFDQAQDHFRIGKFGALEGKTARGKATIEICDLNRPALREARERAHKEILTRIAEALQGYSKGRTLANLWYCETDQFSTYLNCFLEDYFKKMLRSRRHP